MRFFTAVFIVVAALVNRTVSAPASLRDVEKYNGPASGKYIVTLKKGVHQDSVLRRAGVNVTDSWTIINGFAGKFSFEALDALRSHPDVESISEDSIVKASFTQDTAVWGLARISSSTKLADQNPKFDFNFTYNYAATGKGVDVYVVDTGIRITHQQFLIDRARWGANFISGSPNTDENGHGTHVAGTVAGLQFGVAKDATVIAVKVLDKTGSGSVVGIISGLAWVANAVRSSGRPSIATMSLGASSNLALDTAVRAAIALGIHVVVAAGNDNADASNTSPARVSEAITVGATNIADERAFFSNFGPVVDIFAPGQNIISAWFAGDFSIATLSGTSMATPHVTGFVAYCISLRGNLSPAAMSDRVKQIALQGSLSGLPPDTPNRLLNNQSPAC